MTISRTILLLACVVIYVAMATYTLFVFLKRNFPWWERGLWGGVIGCRLLLFLLVGLRPLSQ